MTDSAAHDVSSLYLRYGASVVRRARQILRSDDAAQEILQEVFARLVARPELIHRMRDPSTFLYSLTTHACLNRVRDQKNRDRLLEREVEPWGNEHARGSLHERAVVLDVLAKLSEESATAVICYYLDGMSHAEIAEVLGCSRRHVGNLLDRVQSWARELAAEAI